MFFEYFTISFSPTLDHSNKHVKQNLWKQESVYAIFSIWPRHMEQVGSGDLHLSSCLRLESASFVPEFSSPELGSGTDSFLTSLFSTRVAGEGVRSNAQSAMSGGVAGHSMLNVYHCLCCNH